MIPYLAAKNHVILAVYVHLHTALQGFGDKPCQNASNWSEIVTNEHNYEYRVNSKRNSN